MAKEQTDTQEVKTKRQLFGERMKERRPDLNVDDDEELFGAIGEDYDTAENDLKDLRGGNDAILDIFNKVPGTAEFFIQLGKEGTSPFEYFVEKYGDEFFNALQDYKENPDSPEVKKIAEMHKKYLKNLSNAKLLEEEAEKNLPATLDALDEAATELGASDEDKQKAFEMFTHIQDDAIKDLVSKDTWIMFLKGITHDADVEDATATGEIAARNAKIEQKLRKPKATRNIPPQIGGQTGAPMADKGLKFGGALDKDYTPWDER